MNKAQRCPVCFGRGKLKESYPGYTSVQLEKVCHGCGGKGWVEVKAEEVEEVRICPECGTGLGDEEDSG